MGEGKGYMYILPGEVCGTFVDDVSQSFQTGPASGHSA